MHTRDRIRHSFSRILKTALLLSLQWLRRSQELFLQILNRASLCRMIIQLRSSEPIDQDDIETRDFALQWYLRLCDNYELVAIRLRKDEF